MNRNKRLIATLILVGLLLFILGMVFFNKKKNNDFKELEEESTAETYTLWQ